MDAGILSARGSERPESDQHDGEQERQSPHGRSLSLASGAVSRRLLLALVLLLGACGSGDDASAIERGFVQDMLDHHEQAVRMALLVLGMDDASPVTHAFAVDVVASQRYEIGMMDAHLIEHGDERGAPGREVMAWMDMATSFDEMPGLATRDELDALAAASGSDADARFFRLMIEHHRGGLHMAEFAVEHAEDQLVHALAERIVSTQTKEIAEMQAAQAQLGLRP